MLLVSLWRRIIHFYAHECCWPYSLAFYVTLVIYGVERMYAQSAFPWGSVLAYGILAAYYIHNVIQYRPRLSRGVDTASLLTFLTVKVAIWGALLVLLFAL